MGYIFESTVNTRPILEGSLRYIRSDVPVQVSESERVWLLEHDVTTIVDLRTDGERRRKNCPLAEDRRFRYHCRPVTGGDAVPPSVDDVSRSYLSMADERLMETIELMETAPSNVLYFCNAGKDRTGVVSAILLHRAGMSAEYIVGDYMKSRENLKERLEAFARQEPTVDISVVTPNERYIREFLEWYSAAHPSAE